MISEKEYLNKYSNFVNKKDEIPDDKDDTKKANKNDDDKDDGCFFMSECAFTCIVFIICIIILLTNQRPKYN